MKPAPLVLFCALLLSADAAVALRCGTKLVGTGDTLFKVYKTCGEPALVEKRRVVRAGLPSTRHSDWRTGFGAREILLHQRSLEEVEIEEWTYNFGPTRFIRRIRFENGIVVRIEEHGRGFR